jgi:methionyl aminopeptidase
MAIITVKAEIDKLRRSGQIAHQALKLVAAAIRPGVSTAELDKLAEDFVLKSGAHPAFKGYQGYPNALCVSINDEVVHGIPSDKKILQDGDIVGIDIGIEYGGLYSDHALTIPVGQISKDAKRLINDTKKSLSVGLKQIKPGRRIGDIGAAIEQYLKPRGYGIVRQLTGHGLGHQVHEEPAIPNFGTAGTGPVIVTGMVLAIEPMVNLGGPDVETLADGWTMVTSNHSLSAHFEHTIIVTDRGCEIITA